ncbi:MAG: hypothetical protein ACFFAK_10030 [Promethearchaeota archaeon]
MDRIFEEEPEKHSNKKLSKLDNLQHSTFKQNSSMDAKIKHRKRREGD